MAYPVFWGGLLWHIQCYGMGYYGISSIMGWVSMAYPRTLESFTLLCKVQNLHFFCCCLWCNLLCLDIRPEFLPNLSFMIMEGGLLPCN